MWAGRKENKSRLTWFRVKYINNQRANHICHGYCIFFADSKGEKGLWASVNFSRLCLLFSWLTILIIYCCNFPKVTISFFSQKAWFYLSFPEKASLFHYSLTTEAIWYYFTVPQFSLFISLILKRGSFYTP